MEADVEEADKQVDVGEVPPTGDLAPEQAPVPRATLPAIAGFWAGNQTNKVARRDMTTSSKAWCKVPAIQAE